MPIAAAIPSIISGGTSLIGGLLGSNAASKAAKMQAEAANKVAGMSTLAGDKAAAGVTAAGNTAATGVTGAVGNIDSTLSNTLAPYLQAGTQGVNSLAAALQPGGSLTQQFQFDPSQIANDPGYQFQLNEGMKALQRSAAARGGLQGGGTLKAITQYGQGLAGTEFQNAYNRAANTFQLNRQNTMQGLSLLTGLGQNAANNFSNLYANTNLRGAEAAGNFGLQGAESAGRFGLQGTELAGNAILGGANAQAAGTVGAANSWQSALGGVGTAAQGYSLRGLLNPGAGGSFGGFATGGGANQVGTGLPDDMMPGGIPAGAY